MLNDGSANYLYGHARLATLAEPWYIGDALGSVRQTLDGTGAVLATTAYDPWGTPQDALATPFGFTGELQHDDLVHLRARWYAPGNGTFTSRDRFPGWPAHPASLHPYGYAGNNPVFFTDPTGQCYPPLGWLRDIEPTNCHNLDMAIKIATHPNVAPDEYALAAGYISAFVGSHAILVVGAGILSWQAIAAGAGVVTAVSQWGAAHVVAGTAVGQSITLGSTGVAVGGTAYTAYQAAQGDIHAQTALANPGVYGAATVWNDLAEAAYTCRFFARPSALGKGTSLLGPKPQLLTPEDWGAWGSSPYAGDMKMLAQSKNVREAISRVPKNWSVTPQAEGEGWLFTNPDPSAAVTEVRIKAPMAKFNPEGQYYYAQLRLGKKIENHPWADPQYNMVYYDRNLNLVDQSPAGRDLSHITIYYDRTYRPH